MSDLVAHEAEVAIDPFSPTRQGGYLDALVAVRAARSGASLPGPLVVRTEHFDVGHEGRRLRIDHRVRPGQVDDDLAGLIAHELFGPGWLRGAELFERIFTGVVRSMSDDALASWELFYRNTLRRVSASVTSARTPSARAHGTIAGYAPVYVHAESLLAPGSVLELGSCFGFLALRLALAGRETTASDLSAGTVRLLAEIAPRLGVRLHTRVADAARFPAPDRYADTVLAIHLLEHLEPEHGDHVVAEALRLAARRVVIAVPLEAEADETWGHVRTVDLTDLDRWGRTSGLPYSVHEHHGGWLVIDTA